MDALSRRLKPWQPRRRTLLALVAAGALLVTGAAAGGGVLRSLQLESIDARFGLRGERAPDHGIVIVALDGRSIARLGARPPLPRSFHARLLERVHAGGPRLIAYDFQFVNRTEAAEDRALLRALRRARPVLLATHDVRGPTPIQVPAGEDARRFGSTAATVTLLADEDGAIRRIPYRGTQWPAFAVTAAELASGTRADPDGFPAFIDYRGPGGTFPTYAFSRVLSGAVDAATFRDKIVIVGASDPIQKDVFETPVSDALMPGAEIHANAIATILDGLPLDASSAWLDVVLTLALGLAIPLGALRLATLTSMAVAVGIGGLFLVAAQLAFEEGLIVEVIYPLLALSIAAVGTVVVDYMTANRDRLRLRQAFVRFVPEQVVGDVMARVGDDLRLAGTTLEATVLFCDLREFTRFAESHPASVVIDVLNRFLTEMTEAIMGHGGTVVGYMGDGIMAVFGAPIEQDDNADRALAAAREMIDERLPRFNDWLVENDMGPGFRMGVGLNTGPVRSGTVGSDQRLEYAAVGDTTNVAARVEAHTKRTSHALLMSESTRTRVTVGDDLIFVGEELLRGRTAPTRLWSITSAERTPGPDAAAVPPSREAAGDQPLR